MARLAPTVAALLLVAACGNNSQQVPTGPTQPGPTQPGPTQPGPTQPGPTQPKKPDAPTLDVGSIPSQTCSKEVGITGTAMPGASVFAVGGASTAGVATDAHPVTGRFCLPVSLKPGSANIIEVRAQHPDLGISDSTKITISQQACSGGGDDVGNGGSGSGSGGATTPTAKNVAIGATVTSKDSPEKGNNSFVTDGKSSTVAFFKGGSLWCNWCDYKGWVMVKLDKLVEVSKIIVKWRDTKGAGTAYGKEYKVLVSSMSDPGDPDLDNGKWVEVKSYSDGDGGIDAIDLRQSKPLTQWVAIWLQQDAYPWTKEFVGKEEFALAEIEVYDSPKAAPKPQETSVCQ